MSSPSVGKIIFIGLKVLLIAVMLILGILAHCKAKQRDNRIIGLLLLYLVVLVLIAIFELVIEYIPIIYIILVITSASQVYQVNIFVNNCKDYLKPGVLKRNRIVMLGFMVLYFTGLILTFVAGVGARCGRKNMIINGRTYPACFVILLITNFLFWIFTFIQTCRNYEIDTDLLNYSAELQTKRFKQSGLNHSHGISPTTGLQGLSEMESQQELLVKSRPQKKGCLGVKPSKNTPWIDIFKYQTRQWEAVHTVQIIAGWIIIGLQFNLQQQEKNGTPQDDLMLICYDDGLEWHSQGTLGGLFMLLHTIVMITSALQVERAFYSVLHHTQYFDGELPINESVMKSIHQNDQENKASAGTAHQ